MKLNPSLLKSTVVAALGGLLFGFDTAVISGTTHGLTEQYHLTPDSLGITVASALVGTLMGAALAAFPGDRYGRRDSLRVMAVLYFVSALGCALAWNWPALVLFRFTGGLGIGGSSVLGPMYIAEISPASWRGRLVGFFQFNIVFGILLAYLSNYLIGLGGLGAAEWRWELGISAFPAFLFFLMLFGIPRSPRWLAEVGRVDESRRVLQLIGEENYEQRLREIVDSIAQTKSGGKEALFQRRYALPIFLAISIGAFNQLSGNLQAVAIGATNLLFTMLAMSVIDRLGRKTLLLIGSVGTAVCLAGVSTIFSMHRYEDKLVWLLIGYIAFFAVSQGAVIWVYISEVFPNLVRAKGQSLGSSTHWVMNALISLTFRLLAKSCGAYAFVFFGVMMVLQFCVVLFFYPETMGISLEQLQHRLCIAWCWLA